jgi:hypothetical protein
VQNLVQQALIAITIFFVTGSYNINPNHNAITKNKMKLKATFFE